MRKPRSVILPPLRPERLHDLELSEKRLHAALNGCYDFQGRNLNDNKALEYLTAYAVEFLELYLAAFSEYRQYNHTWTDPIKVRALHRAMTCYQEYKDPNSFSFGVYKVSLAKTLDDHVKDLIQQTVDKVKPSPNINANRAELRKTYELQHPGVMVLDICWAASQHYSEWKRWLRNAVKDGSAPDRAFRALLESGKSPREYRKAPRPDGWK